MKSKYYGYKNDCYWYIQKNNKTWFPYSYASWKGRILDLSFLLVILLMIVTFFYESIFLQAVCLFSAVVYPLLHYKKTKLINENRSVCFYKK